MLTLCLIEVVFPGDPGEFWQLEGAPGGLGSLKEGLGALAAPRGRLILTRPGLHLYSFTGGGRQQAWVGGAPLGPAHLVLTSRLPLAALARLLWDLSHGVLPTVAL